MSSFKDSLLNSAVNLRGLPIQPTNATKIPSVESLEKGKRGLVLFPPCSISDDGNKISMGGQINPITLRKSVLFWDKLEVPKNNLLEIGYNLSLIHI